MDGSSSMNNSSMNRGVVSNIINNNNSTEEESGWTAYFEDFSNHREEEGEEDSFCNSGFFGSSSMVSDAASFPAWKSSSPSNNQHHHHNYNNHVVFASCSSIEPSPKLPNKLNFKKTSRAKGISLHDDSLEDTASSPVNSPKVSYFGPTSDHINPRKPNDHFNSSLGKGGILEHYEQELETENERCEMNCSSSSNNNHRTDLKKRGLCLVPLSMLVNYLG
ncbi:hypothetical protein JCGZ_22873 [Jatropha curcas]|uniref:Uncharacterized protein n=1 Tax=Jatropha curcas TaxID=180498 RepID=A0A067JSR3_JATCU|nr:vascular-related unknown protein 1 [Jatropha curcas]KDP25843.1 hypothetical protein JCGZ_22873 [Jatropha curcas]